MAVQRAETGAIARGLTMLFPIIFFSVRLDVGTLMI